MRHRNGVAAFADVECHQARSGHLECHDTFVSAQGRDVDEPGGVHDGDRPGCF
jgi:hypothetical protein